MDIKIVEIADGFDRIKQYIIEGSKTLATYLGWRYVPFEEGLKIKAGWYKTTQTDKEPLPKSGLVRLDENTLGKYVCRNHSQLSFYSCYNALFEVVDKIEKEDLSEYGYKWEDFEKIQYNNQSINVDVDSDGVNIYMNRVLDPSYWLHGYNAYKDLPKKQQLFYCLVAAIKKINEMKTPI